MDCDRHHFFCSEILMKKSAYPAVCLILLFSFFSPAEAAILWVNPKAATQPDGKTKETGFHTIWAALDVMETGDTLIVADGDWSNGYPGMTIESRPHLPPSGTGYDRPTVIRAETDWGAKLPAVRDLGIGRKYVVIRGFFFSGGASLMNWRHCKMIRCGFLHHAQNENAGIFSLSHGQFNLVEECMAMGRGRYGFLEYKGAHNIWRRCLARHGAGGPDSGFRGYGSLDSVWQNCISIHFGHENPKKQEAGFRVEAGTGGIRGCVAVTGMHPAFLLSGAVEKKAAVLVDSASLALCSPEASGFDAIIRCSGGTASIHNVLAAGCEPEAACFLSNEKGSGNISVSGAIALNTKGLLGNGISARQLWHYNTTRGNFGEHPVFKNPFENGLWYPVRVEENSGLAKGDNTGEPFGPEILYRIGVFGKAKDEPGWDQKTGLPLWPFPNEKKWENLVPEAKQVQDFCKKGLGLTHCIWEYFHKPAPPFNLKVEERKGDLLLKWDPPSRVENLTGFKVYNVTAGSKVLWDKVMGNQTFSTSIPGLIPGLTYRFSVSAEYENQKESATVYPVEFHLQ